MNVITVMDIKSYKFLILQHLNITEYEDPINLFCNHINILQ